MKKVVFAVLLVMGLGIAAEAGDADLAYFKSFLFKKESTSNDPDFPSYQYRYLMADMDSGKFVNEEGKTVIPWSNIYLYEDGTYLLEYKEMYEWTMSNGQTGIMPGPCQKIEGKWSVPETLLALDDLATGDRFFEDSQHKVKAT